MTRADDGKGEVDEQTSGSDRLSTVMHRKCTKFSVLEILMGNIFRLELEIQKGRTIKTN